MRSCPIPLPAQANKAIIEGINDSKKLSPKKREELFDKITQTAIDYKIVEVGHSEIDERNILNATKLAMKQACMKLTRKPNVVLTDFVHIDIDVPQVNITHGDSLSYNIAAASIVAKVYRDRLMIQYAKKYPNYGFEKHKGYGTSEHIANLKKYGACGIHRKTFLKTFLKVDSRLD